MRETDINESIINTERRASKARGNLLQYLYNSTQSIENEWKLFSTIKVKNQAFMEDLSSILINVNSIKELSINKGMIYIATQIDELEIALIELIDFPEVGDALLYQAIFSKINDLNGNLTHLLNEYKNLSDIPAVDIDHSVEQYIHTLSKSIFIISNDQHFIAEYSQQIGHYGYFSHAYSVLEDFLHALEKGKPAAIIADYDLFHNNEEHNLLNYNSKHSSIPLIVVSSDGGFESRLQAVKSGSTAFFTKPVNASLLLDKLDTIIYSAITVEPYKVLVIDDSRTISTFLSRTLSRVGMTVHVETTPEAALNVIADFNPDLILMDMYMPVCDGEDLCRIIRQYESFTSIPIVFLSSETDVKKQLNAMKIGADDFLTKEIDPQHLITSITTRIERHKVLSSFMIRDSLTGLLNHTTSKKQLEQMIIKARSLHVPLAFAMVDIDKFKLVNDTYGHPTGDVVIKSLARILKKRLRRTDSIGRYGGEEFAIVFWETSAKHAKRILDEIREDFSQIAHIHENTTFFTTFSAGIAEFPQYNSAEAISIEADKALYVAKTGGRNQVCVAKEEPDFK